MEKWRNIPGYPNYEASDLGRIRSIERVNQFGHKLESKILSYHLSPKGYLCVSVGDRLTIGRTKRLHRLVALAFLPNPEKLSQVNHKNGNKSDNRIENLEWISNSNNKKHAVANSLYAYGSKHGRSKLKEQEVKAIKFLIKRGVFYKCIAPLFNVSKHTIDAIATRRLWRHVD
jgi:hypothetical protein